MTLAFYMGKKILTYHTDLVDLCKRVITAEVCNICSILGKDGRLRPCVENRPILFLAHNPQI